MCTECKLCDTSCYLCSGPGPVACVTCAAGLFKVAYAAPDIAITDPKFGKTYCQANCINDTYYKDTVKF